MSKAGVKLEVGSKLNQGAKLNRLYAHLVTLEDWSHSFETCSNQLSTVKNIYVDTKINILKCQGAELHLEVDLDPVVGIVIGVGVHLAVLKPVPINSALSKTYIWTPRSTFYDAWELSYTLKWTWTLLLQCCWCWCTSASSKTGSNQLSMVENIYLDTKIILLWCTCVLQVWANYHWLTHLLTDMSRL